MIRRSLPIAVLLALSVTAVAQAAPGETLASFKPDANAIPNASYAPPTSASRQASVAAYRQYVKTQADSLVGMTRFLAGEIRKDHLDSAQSAYAPTHRYLKRVATLARVFPDLARRMDARAADYEKGETDPGFAGFHRLERGLFAQASTSGLSEAADRLHADARDLRERMMRAEIEPLTLVDGASRLVRDLAENELAGAEELYSRTDLWDVEASLDGAREIMALAQPEPASRNTKTFTRINAHLAEINALLEKQKAGCGFKNFNELSAEEKATLRTRVTALADTLATLRGKLAMD